MTETSTDWIKPAIRRHLFQARPGRDLAVKVESVPYGLWLWDEPTRAHAHLTWRELRSLLGGRGATAVLDSLDDVLLSWDELRSMRDSREAGSDPSAPLPVREVSPHHCLRQDPQHGPPDGGPARSRLPRVPEEASRPAAARHGRREAQSRSRSVRSQTGGIAGLSNTGISLNTWSRVWLTYCLMGRLWAVIADARRRSSLDTSEGLMTGPSNQSPLDLPCTNGRAKALALGGDPCRRRAVKFYRDPSTGFMFATCQRCLGQRAVKGGYVRITEREYQVRQVLES